MIPFIDLKAQYARLKDDLDARIHAVLDDGRYIMGPMVGEVERELADYAGAKHCISCASGTDALFMALLAYEISVGDAVFVPGFTYTATAETILLAGATPVFVDVDPDTFLIDETDLVAKIQATLAAGQLTPRMILAVDLFGQPADYPSLNGLAAEHGMKVMADAAQGFGGMLGNARVGSLTDVTTTSFFPAKPLGCYGDGGAIFTEDDGLADVLRSIRLHGKGEAKYDVVRIGVNGRLDTIQAAVLLGKLTVFEDEMQHRQRVAARYDAGLDARFQTPVRVPDSRSAWAQYTIKTPGRDWLIAHCKEAGIPTSVFYPRPMHLQPAYRAYGDGEGSLPVSERLSGEVVSLPMHPYLEDAEIDRICEVVNSYRVQEAAE